MSYASIATGLYYPPPGFLVSALGNAGTLAATTDKFAMIGCIYIDGRPAAAKTLSTGTIQFRTGSCTFANGSTTMDVGIQDVATGSGPIAQPDGTFDVKKTLTGGAGITASAWNTVTMNTGSKSITHGDIIAVVLDMTNRAGADSVTVNTASTNINTLGSQYPITNAFTSSAWQTTATAGAGRLPNVIITFDDGTVGWFDGTFPITAALLTESFQDSTNPDERGMIFQVPFDCKIDGFHLMLNITAAGGDCTLNLYSDPTGTPSAIASIPILGEQSGINSASPRRIATLASEVALTANTDYALTLLATGTSNVTLLAATLADTSHRASIPGGTTLKKVTRNNSTGAFTTESPAVSIYEMGVRISSVSTGSAVGTVIGS